jgi:hypothetical protein
MTAVLPQAGEPPEPGAVIAPVAPVAPAVPPAGEPPADPDVSTHLAAMSDEELDRLPRRRSLALPILGGLGVLAFVGGAIVLTHRTAALAPAIRDAGTLALAQDAAELRPDVRPELPVDAPAVPVVPMIPADAMPIDAGQRPVRPARDAGRTVAIDAELAAGSPADTEGLGFLTAKHKGRYLSVLIDGQYLGPTPQYHHQIPAGPHVIQLVDPQTSEVVVKRAVKVGAGETVTIVEP